MWTCVVAVIMSTSTAMPPRALRPPTLRRFNVGATKPAGWLQDELLLQAHGVSTWANVCVGQRQRMRGMRLVQCVAACTLWYAGGARLRGIMP